MAALAGAERAVAILICCRLMAATMDPATKLKTKVEGEVNGDAYTASGSTVTDASWIAVDEACRAALAGGDKAAEDEDDEAQGQEDADRALYEALAADARKTEEDAANALDSIAAELGELMGESELNDTDTNDLIGEGEEL